MDRVELEDKCHQVFEENQLLKKHAKAQEEKMKKFVSLQYLMGVVWFASYLVFLQVYQMVHAQTALL